MTMLSDLLSNISQRRVRFAPRRTHDARDIDQCLTDLISGSGEASGRSTAETILDRYEAMDAAAKTEFFRFVVRNMDLSPDAVRAALEAYETYPDRRTYGAFMEAAEPRRQELLRRLNQVPGATERLVRMRAELLKAMKHEPELGALDVDFHHLFTSWFNRGFLVLKPINWESPAHILEKIIAYEAVHAIETWGDLRRRVQPADRRCFAFFHPAMPDEPLIFVQVALTRGVPNSVQGLLAEDRAPLATDEADTAVFYSISNCQAGLAGISFGNSLIKQVAADLALELPALKTFVTLSPIPGFAGWLAKSPYLVDTSEPEAMRVAAAHYLADAKRDDGKPLDAVARFHLGNGAQIHAVHADADISEKGLAQSRGAMVNYLYDLPRVAENHERFVGQNAVATSPDIRNLASQAAKTLTRKHKDDEPAL
ncbi:MAG: malonyl-CoA decarboxylase [Pseudomonadota bacterium]